MAAPPVNTGDCQFTVSVESPVGCTATFVGAPGTAVGTPIEIEEDEVEVPFAFVAVTEME